MPHRIASLTFIFICTTVAWGILGATIDYRTTAPTQELRSQVANTWGAPHEQKPPSACFKTKVMSVETITQDGKTVEKKTEREACEFLPLESSNIVMDLDLDHRQKGLLWFSTYRVRFDGSYTFRNNINEEKLIEFNFPYPAAQATYDGLVVSIDGSPVPNLATEGSVRGTKAIPAGQMALLTVSYRSQGLDRWIYNFSGHPAHLTNFILKMTTNFKAIDFPENTLSPTTRQETNSGWNLTWNYSSLLTSYSVAMEMPGKLQPGPLAGQISYFAPVSLFFFFFLIFIITTIRGIDLHPMNYFFLAAAFFAFHLLLAYLVDHLSIHLSFLICSVVSVFLVVSYLRLVVDMRFALIEAAGAQVIYLVLFSYAFFFRGFTGLTITIGSIITLFIVMQTTAKVKWEEKFTAHQ